MLKVPTLLLIFTFVTATSCDAQIQPQHFAPPYQQSPPAVPYPQSAAVSYTGPPASMPFSFMVSTTPTVDGYRIREYKGIARGVYVSQPTIGQNFKAGFQGMFGGKVGAYMQMCDQARQQSYDSMVAQARAL